MNDKLRSVFDALESSQNGVGMFSIACAFVADSWMSNAHMDKLITRVNNLEAMRNGIYEKLSNIDQNIAYLLQESRSSIAKDKEVFVRINVLETRMSIIEKKLDNLK